MLKRYSDILRNAPESKAFYTADGQIKNIAELKNCLVGRGKPFYNEYVDHKDNHFANWVEAVFGDHELARQLRKANYHKTIKLLEDKVTYAKLGLAFNTEKESFFNHLAKMQPAMFEPEHHEFVTLAQFNQSIKQDEPDGEPEPIAPEPIQPLEPPAEEPMDDMQLLEELRKHYQIEPPKPNFFERLASRFKR